MDRFSFMIQDHDKKLLLLKSYQVNLRSKIIDQILEILDSNRIIDCELNHTTIAFYSDHYCISNIQNFKKNNNRGIISRESYLLKNHQAYNEPLTPSKVISYAIDQNLEICFDTIFKHYLIKPQSFFLLNQYLSVPNADSSIVFINFTDCSFQITILNAGEIMLHKNIKYNSVYDSLYFIVREIQVLGLNTNNQKIYLSGFLTKDSEIYHILYSYFREIKFLYFDELSNINGLSDEFNQHFYYDLFSMSSCEL
jgi:hypothetical protein